MGSKASTPHTSAAKQPSDPVIPWSHAQVSSSDLGKTVTLISLILEQYRGVFERIYILARPSTSTTAGFPQQLLGKVGLLRTAAAAGTEQRAASAATVQCDRAAPGCASLSVHLR